MRATTRTIGGFLFGALSLVLAGCYGAGGPGWSADQHTYESRQATPWTVTLEDTRTGEVFWSYEVPVGRQLVIRFLPDQGTEGGQTPDKMQWAEMDLGDEFGKLENSIPVPPASARLLKPTMRTVPELPPDMIAEQGTEPTVPLQGQ